MYLSRARGMSRSETSLLRIVQALESHYGEPDPLPVTDPLGIILWENVAYLVGDDKRQRAFAALQDLVGLDPEEILSAPPETLLEVAVLGGMHAEKRVEKLRRVAEIASTEVDLEELQQLPGKKARSALKKFPGIGDPGAEKILLFTGTEAVLALESNGLRVLVRLGYGEERSSYSATYRSVREALSGQFPQDCSWLIQTHQLLRQHGLELCRRSQPACSACPLQRLCAYAAGTRKK